MLGKLVCAGGGCIPSSSGSATARHRHPPSRPNYCRRSANFDCQHGSKTGTRSASFVHSSPFRWSAGPQVCSLHFTPGQPVCRFKRCEFCILILLLS